MKLTRRTTLSLLAAGGASLAYGGYSWSQRAYRHTGPARPLAIPPLENGVMRDGVRHYDLQLRKGVSQFFEGVSTPTFGINGDYLGPVLKLRAGERVRLNVENQIGQPSTLHWHGMHLPATADGGPHQIIDHGKSWAPEFEIRQRAGTFWYHSHMLHQTGFQVFHGLAGMMIVEDAEATNLDLPQEYGVDDIPLVLQDRRFNRNGTLDYLSAMPDRMMGMHGDILLVNGTHNPYVIARTNTLRLRILNGSNARFYGLGFQDGRRFHQIASDGGLLEQPFETDQITLAPGERAEVVVDVSDGKPALLQSVTPPQGGMMGGGMMGGMMDDDRSFDVLEIRPDEGRRPALRLPDRLTALDIPDPSKAIKTRRFTLEMAMGPAMMMGGKNAMSINGRSMDKNRIDETVRLGTSEIWEIENPSMLAHPFHIHDVQFRVLDRNGAPPAPGEAGLKDTIVVAPNEKVRLLLSFADYADPDLPYMYHCHILEHEDAGMMGQFAVVG